MGVSVLQCAGPCSVGASGVPRDGSGHVLTGLSWAWEEGDSPVSDSLGTSVLRRK
jgi:hypothetical protein